MNSNDGKRNATRYRLVVGGILVLGTALLGLSGASGGGSGTQAAVVRAQGATPPATITFPVDPTASTTPTTAAPATVPPTAAPAPQPIALAAPPEPAAAAAPAEPAPAAAPEPAPSPASGDAVLDAINQYFGDVYNQAVGVARCESGLDPNAVSSGGYNWGLFQINIVHKSRVEAMGYSWDQILDPYVNAAVARSIYDDAGGWGPWGCRRAAY